MATGAGFAASSWGYRQALVSSPPPCRVLYRRADATVRFGYTEPPMVADSVAGHRASAREPWFQQTLMRLRVWPALLKRKRAPAPSTVAIFCKVFGILYDRTFPGDRISLNASVGILVGKNNLFRSGSVELRRTASHWCRARVTASNNIGGVKARIAFFTPARCDFDPPSRSWNSVLCPACTSSSGLPLE